MADKYRKRRCGRHFSESVASATYRVRGRQAGESPLKWASDEHQGRASSRQEAAPFFDEPAVFLADSARLAVEIIQPHRVYAVAFLTQGNIPVDLVGQAVPRESD